MTPNRRWICGLAVVLSACSGAAREDAVPVAAEVARGTIATPTLDGVRKKNFVQCGVTTGVAGFSTPDAQGGGAASTSTCAGRSRPQCWATRRRSGSRR